MNLRRPMKRPPQKFVTAPGQNEGQPVVVLDFGRLGRVVLDGDDVERLKNELDRQLRAARAMGQT